MEQEAGRWQTMRSGSDEENDPNTINRSHAGVYNGNHYLMNVPVAPFGNSEGNATNATNIGDDEDSMPDFLDESLPDLIEDGMIGEYRRSNNDHASIGDNNEDISSVGDDGFLPFIEGGSQSLTDFQEDSHSYFLHVHERLLVKFDFDITATEFDSESYEYDSDETVSYDSGLPKSIERLLEERRRVERETIRASIMANLRSIAR